MVSIEKIILKFQRLDEYLSVLEKISKTSKDDFLTDKILKNLKH